MEATKCSNGFGGVSLDAIQKVQYRDDDPYVDVNEYDMDGLSYIDMSPSAMGTMDIMCGDDDRDLTTLTPAAVSSLGEITVVTSGCNESSSFFVPSPSCISASSPYGEERENSPMMSPNSCYDIVSVITVAPDEVCGEHKRKRGRRPKSETGIYVPPPRARKPRKRKVYEIDQPLEDAELERKRLNAVNAKRHRDAQKKTMQKLEEEIKAVKSERDNLQEEIQGLRIREKKLLEQVEAFKKHALSLLTIIQE